MMKRPILVLCDVIFITSVHAQTPPSTADDSSNVDPLLKSLIIKSMRRIVGLASPECQAIINDAESNFNSKGTLPDPQKIVPACRKEIGVAALVALLALAVANSGGHHHHHDGYRHGGGMPFD